MLNKKNVKNQKGFTLIEIISVLVILGILAAVAIPRYLDLQSEARMKAAQAAIAEVKSRASSAFATYLLVNNGAMPADASALNVNYNVGIDYSVNGVANGNNILITVSQVQNVNLTNNVTGTWVMAQ